LGDMRLAISFVVLISTTYSGDFTTYIGGAILNTTQSVIGGLAADSHGNTYVTGSNAFVTKLDPSGNIVFTTAFGQGGSYSYGYSIAVDSSDNIWVGGQTVAANFPLTNALQSSVVSSGSGFLVKMAPDGTVLYASYFGGTLGASAVNGIATDPSGNVYVTGWTNATDFPTTPGLPASPVSGGAAPVYGLLAAKLTSSGQKILYSTVIAGSANCAFCVPVPKTLGAGIAVDGSGNALVAGSSNTHLPVVTNDSSGPGAFVFKINAAGDGIVYFTDLGAVANSTNSVPASITVGARPIAADASGNAYLTGYTNSPDFPATPGAYQTTYDAGNNPEAFAMKLNPSGTTVWATLLGGMSSPNAVAAAIQLDSSDNIWLTGTNGIMSSQNPGFVAELKADGSALQYLGQFPLGEVGQDIAVDLNGVIHVGGPTGLVSTITPMRPMGPRALSLVNAGSGQFSGTIAPGEIISLYGTGLGPAIPVAASPQNGFFPTSLGGVQVLVDDQPIPLLYVSGSQINAEIPSRINGLENGLADVRVRYNSAVLPDLRVLVTTAVLGAFYSSGAYLAVTNQDGSVNSQRNPATPGSYVSLWATGLSGPDVVMDGAIAIRADNYCSSCQVTFITYGFDVTETVQYAGPSPGLIDGLMQINVIIPTQTQAQSHTPQLQVLSQSTGTLQFLGFLWVSQ
jgi:uncharacterized protein (TIGR03437 family)